eukprot:SAG11_NODE_4_length_33019_cov_28.098909_10_plen_80_part_00
MQRAAHERPPGTCKRRGLGTDRRKQRKTSKGEEEGEGGEGGENKNKKMKMATAGAHMAEPGLVRVEPGRGWCERGLGCR